MNNKLPEKPVYKLQHNLVVLALTAILLMVSLACEVGPTMEWVKTVTLKTPTPDVLQTSAALLTATEMVGKVTEMVGKKQILVDLDPLRERDISGVDVKTMQIGNIILVETNDPQGRYLPDAEIVPADREPVQQVLAQQVNSAWKWGFKLGNGLDVSPLLEEALGSMPLGSVLPYLSDNWKEKGVNIVLPALDSYSETQSFTIYLTQAKHTLVLVPPESTAGTSPRLAAAAPAATDFSAYVVFNFATIPDGSMLTYINQVTGALVGNYIGAAATDVTWAEQKVREIDKGLPEGYTAPNGVSPEIINWLDFDQTFVESVRFLGSEQRNEPCVKADQLNKVIKQKPAPGKTLNGLRKKVTLTICDQVVSQKKYETLIFQSPTVTITPTITRTFTPRPSITLTRTQTPVPSVTKAPTASKSPSGPTQTARSSATAGKATSAAGTATQKSGASTAKAATLTATHTTPTRTATLVPVIVDEFVTADFGFDSNNWDVTDTGTGTRTWPREERMHQEVDASSGTGDQRLITKQSCLLGEAQFSMRSSETGSGYIQAGWSDADLNNGIYIESDPTDTTNTKFLFTVMAAGTPTSKAVVLNTSSNGAYTTYRIVWAYKDSVDIEAKLNVDNSNIHDYTITANKPENRLKFLLRNAALSNADPLPNGAWIELEYVHIYSSSCS